MNEAVLAIADYARFQTTAGSYVPLRDFQNFFVSQTRTWAGVQYLFAPFGLDGDSSIRAGETPQASLVSVQNALTVSWFVEAVTQRYLCEIEKVAIEITPGSPPTFAEKATLGKHIWAVTGYEMPADGESISLRLTGPRNAVDRQTPSGRLTSALVGALPATGNIYTS